MVETSVKYLTNPLNSSQPQNTDFFFIDLGKRKIRPSKQIVVFSSSTPTHPTATPRYPHPNHPTSCPTSGKDLEADTPGRMILLVTCLREAFLTPPLPPQVSKHFLNPTLLIPTLPLQVPKAFPHSSPASTGTQAFPHPFPTSVGTQTPLHSYALRSSLPYPAFTSIQVFLTLLPPPQVIRSSSTLLTPQLLRSFLPFACLHKYLGRLVPPLPQELKSSFLLPQPPQVLRSSLPLPYLQNNSVFLTFSPASTGHQVCLIPLPQKVLRSSSPLPASIGSQVCLTPLLSLQVFISSTSFSCIQGT
jgi:hypothetical protein